VVDESVDHGGGDDVVAEHFSPPAELFVGGDDQAGVFVSGGDELEEQVRRFGFEGDVADLDELGYLQLDRRGAELLFEVLTEREEKASVGVASNEAFSSWTKTFTDPRLCAAIVDRLTYSGQIIETGTASYRLAHARASRTKINKAETTP